MQKMRMGNRDYKITVRFTKKEYEKILTEVEKNVSGSNGKTDISKYVRVKLLDLPMSEREIKKELHDLKFQIRKIGVNINQAVKRINSGIAMTEDDTYLLTELARVEELLRIFLKIVRENKWQ